MAALDGDDSLDDLILQSNDGAEFKIPREFALISKLVSASVYGEPAAKKLPILRVTGDTLKLVVEYMQHHKSVEPNIIPKPLRSKNMQDVVDDPWDAQFIDRVGEDRHQLYDLVSAANYMDIDSLLHLGCAKVASIIKGQPLEKIKELLSIKKKPESQRMQ